MSSEEKASPDVTPQAEVAPSMPKDFKFWAIIGAVLISYFLALLEATSISTALPTIAGALNSNDFIWVGSAYNIAATAFMPLSGGLAQIFGRRPAMLGSMFLFAIGSLVCALARDMNMLIAGRAIQGAGGAGLLAISTIILSDIVSLRERGIYNGLLQLTWCAAAGVGPSIGGALSRSSVWRWIFYINLPLVGLAMLLALIFLRLKTPTDNIREKLGRMDWIGNFLVIASSVSVAIGLTWAGVKYSWSSPQVLAPLILGFLGLGLFAVYEIRWATHPIVPVAAIFDRTCLSGYLQIFCAAIPFVALTFYLPVYFQACKGASPLRSGVELFPLAFTVTPFSILVGFSVARTGRYRPQVWFGWVVIVLAMGLFGGIVDSTTQVSIVIGLQIVGAIGFGIVYSAAYFPVLAPLPSSSSAHSLAFLAFFRQFAGIWAVTIGGAVLQNTMQQRLPPAFNDAIPGGSNAFYEVIAKINGLPEPLRGEVRAAFGDGLKLTWQVVTGISGFGFICSFFMRGLPLSSSTDKDWGLEEKARLGRDPEAGVKEVR